MTNRKTFEIISKWIGKEYGIKIEFCNVNAPRVNLKNKLIQLPNSIEEENAFAAIAEVMHEAAHIRHTPIALENLGLTNFQQRILNAVEDIRIDLKNFGILPNVKEFYREMMKTIEMGRGNPNIIFPAKVMCNIIAELEGFPEYKIRDDEVKKFIADKKLNALTTEIIQQIEYDNYKEAKVKLLKLCKILKEEFEERQKQGKEPPDTDLDSGDGNGDEMEAGGEAAQGEGEDALGRAFAKGMKEAGKDPRKIFTGCGKGAGEGTDIGNITPIALQEQTKKRFTELLNVKEIRKVYEEAGKLDTENIASYFTGDIQDLFSEPKIERKKKSKIVFLLDCSGSMAGGFQFESGSRRDKVTATICKTFVEILEELRAVEGINIDWEIRCFDDSYYILSQDNWEQEYQRHLGGGTTIGPAFEDAVESLASDQVIDGSRLIIVLTDGYVLQEDIGRMRKSIISHGEDVRCLVIGIDSDPVGKFMKDVGAANILGQESAETILLDAIMRLIE